MVAFVLESWVWYVVVLLVAASRFLSRRMTLGSFKRFQPDDYLMLLVLCFYTTLVATINIVRYTSSNLLPPNFDVNSLSAEDVREREYGSKLILVVEQCQCCTIWGAKACLLVLYLRLTTMRWENIGIKILAAYVAFGFAFMEIFYFGVWCRPFYEYWQVSTSNVQCTAATNHLVTNAVFNLSSDCIMLAIGLPMFLRMQLPWKKKFPLVGVFSLGVFVVLAAVLNKVYSFTEPFGASWTYWYIRECSTALLVANLPFVWTFWRTMSGTKTVIGVSRREGRSPDEDTGRCYERDERRWKGSAAIISPRQAGTLLRDNSNKDAEMEEHVERGHATETDVFERLSRDGMLAHHHQPDATSSTHEKGPTPPSPAQPSFGKDYSPASYARGPIPKAAFRSQRELVRGSHLRPQGTP